MEKQSTTVLVGIVETRGQTGRSRFLMNALKLARHGFLPENALGPPVRRKPTNWPPQISTLPQGDATPRPRRLTDSLTRFPVTPFPCSLAPLLPRSQILRSLIPDVAFNFPHPAHNQMEPNRATGTRRAVLQLDRRETMLVTLLFAVFCDLSLLI